MQQNIEFERCIDFLVRMIDKYCAEVLWSWRRNRIRKKKKWQFPEIQKVIRLLLFHVFLNQINFKADKKE